jgi:hypothetical protein
VGSRPPRVQRTGLLPDDLRCHPPNMPRASKFYFRCFPPSSHPTTICQAGPKKSDQSLLQRDITIFSRAKLGKRKPPLFGKLGDPQAAVKMVLRREEFRSSPERAYQDLRSKLIASTRHNQQYPSLVFFLPSSVKEPSCLAKSVDA